MTRLVEVSAYSMLRGTVMIRRQLLLAQFHSSVPRCAIWFVSMHRVQIPPPLVAAVNRATCKAKVLMCSSGWCCGGGCIVVDRRNVIFSRRSTFCMYSHVSCQSETSSLFLCLEASHVQMHPLTKFLTCQIYKELGKSLPVLPGLS